MKCWHFCWRATKLQLTLVRESCILELTLKMLLTVTWLMYETYRHPEVLQKLREEADSIEHAEPDMDDLSKLKYLTMCIKEVLRLYPPGEAFSRSAPAGLKVGDIEIPENVLM